MHEMLDKQSKKEAIAKREDRKKMVTQNVPPTVPGKQNLYEHQCYPVCPKLYKCKNIELFKGRAYY